VTAKVTAKLTDGARVAADIGASGWRPREQGVGIAASPVTSSVGTRNGVRRPWNRALIIWPEVWSPYLLSADPNDGEVCTRDHTRYGAPWEKLPVSGAYDHSGTRFDLQSDYLLVLRFTVNAR
jgi:hypothetical protein